MAGKGLHPSGDKMTRAIKEFSEQLEQQGPSARQKILQQIILKFDLSPKESLFMERHFKEDQQDSQ
ncbi:MAG: hypothetical protein CSB23_03920 [Deltaproteobacteria bacterium]|nr:MAG: hypothetical protein CSB23_03920 [Deltaproteobacteria bacterium]